MGKKRRQSPSDRKRIQTKAQKPSRRKLKSGFRKAVTSQRTGKNNPRLGLDISAKRKK